MEHRKSSGWGNFMFVYYYIRNEEEYKNKLPKFIL